MTIDGTSEDPVALKEEGNKAYKDGNWELAIEKYTRGLEVCQDDKDRLVFYKNRAAVHLKTSHYEEVVCDCSKALEISPQDPKALFRRAQAYDAKQQFDKAYCDIRAAQNVDPKNKDIQNLLAKLHSVVQTQVEANTQLSNRVKQMLDIVFDISLGLEKRETAANNIVTLARESAGSEMLLKEGILGRMVQMVKGEKSEEVRLACTRTLSEFCKKTSQAKKVLEDVGLPFLLELMNSNSAAQVNAAQYVLQLILCTLSGCGLKEEKSMDVSLMRDNKKEIDSIMTVLTTSVTSRLLKALARDAVIELILKYVGYKALDWGDKFIKIGGVQKLLEVASELQEYHYESCIDITDNTRMTTAICLSKVFETQCNEVSRKAFLELVDAFTRDMLLDPTVEGKVRVTVMITTLLLGPLDVGNHLIAKQGMLEMMLSMAETEDELQQKVACEVLIAAASKKDKCRTIILQGTNILKRLYQSKNDSIKVRALVGLCKLGSFGGTDSTMRPFAEGASLKLSEACRRFLINLRKDKDMQRWSCEGLSYLTLDAEVKEKLIEDRAALKAMVQLAKQGDLNCVYGVVTTMVNLCNAYDKQEVIPEMVELAKFAKQHVPEEHELDDKDFVDKRVMTLVEEGAAAALVVLSKTESQNSRELIARIFNAMCEHQQNRGLVVQQGGTKALLNLAQEGTEKGKRCAAQALSRIAITINPEVAFPGQKAYEVVRPLLQLLHIDYTALENFEALMALCNIAGMSESARQRIIKERGMSAIEHYMFEDHELLRRAAIQCMANLCASPDIVKVMEGKNDKLKYLFLCSADEDLEIQKAAAGAVCILLTESKQLCEKIFEAKDWEDTLKFLLSHNDTDIQYRGTVIVYLLMAASKTIAERIIDTHCKDALQAVSKIDNPEFVNPKAQEYASKALKLAIDYKLMKDPDADDN